MRGEPALFWVRYSVYMGSHDEVTMAPTLQDLGLDKLTAEHRLAIAEALWESVIHELEAAPLPAAQRIELERRLADSIARPDAVTPWEVVKARALARARQ